MIITLDFSQFVFPAFSFGFNQTFDVQVVFGEATFLSRIAFPRARFKQRVNFAGARFYESVDFVGARFSGGLWFDQVQFDGDANFGRVECVGEARFLNSTFRGEAIFVNARFSKGVSFSGATFERKANFIDTRLSHEVDFIRATFKQDVDFSLATFASYVEVAAEIVGMQAMPTMVDFSGAHFENPSRVKFSEVNKKSEKGFRARFIDCNIKDVQFVDVNWHRWSGRRVLQDEIDIIGPIKKEESEYQQFVKQTFGTEPTPYELVAAAYRQLINNFEQVRDYDSSEDFSIGAMEMKRLDPAQPTLVRLAVSLYRLVSNYGSSYPRALGVLALMVLVFGLLYSLVGLTPRLGQTVLEPVGFIHAVEVATFKSETHAIAGSGLAWLLEMLERVMIPAQVALFLLALRRRFRR